MDSLYKYNMIYIYICKGVWTTNKWTPTEYLFYSYMKGLNVRCTSKDAYDERVFLSNKREKHYLSI